MPIRSSLFPPQVTGINPASGVVGTQVTITGSGFNTVQGYVRFAGSLATINTWSDTQIVATVASGTRTGSVVVTVNGVDSNSNNTFMMPNPLVTSITPSSGPVNTQVTITGTGFRTPQGNSVIAFGGQAASVQSWADTKSRQPYPAAPRLVQLQLRLAVWEAILTKATPCRRRRSPALAP